MDLILFMNIFFIVVSYLVKRKKECYTAFYSLGLFLFTLTCIYLFYRYGMRESASTINRIYFFSSPFLLTLAIILVYRQSKTLAGIGVKPFLEKALSENTKIILDKIFPAVLFYTIITIIVYALTYFYEKGHPKAIPGDPNQWSFSNFHFIWQYFYIMPMTFMFWHMGIKKFTKTIVTCSILYPLILLLYVTTYIWLRSK